MKASSANAPAPAAAMRPLKKQSFLYAGKICLFSIPLMTAMNQVSTAQCVAPSMTFHSPVLIAGTNNEVGSVYRFSEVMPGVDAEIKVTDLVGGAVLYNIDDSTGAGYYDAFQPYVVAPANTVSYLDWAITFKVGGTSTDTTIACFAITGVDVDGNGADLQEFIEAATPGSYALDPFTILTFSFDGVRSKATSQVANIPLIDTAHREAMFQMNFANISTLQYRNGAISNHGEDMVRQTCIYFKSFFNTYLLLLPVKLISFSAQPKNESVELNWLATNENDLQYYIVQKSNNGINWNDIQKVNKGIASTNNYFITDAGKNNAVVYYRLKQVQRTGQPLYSKVVTINPAGYNPGSITNNTVIKDLVTMQITSATNDNYIAEVYTANGSMVKQQSLKVPAGVTIATIDIPSTLASGLYILTVKNNRGMIIHQSKFIKN